MGNTNVLLQRQFWFRTVNSNFANKIENYPEANNEQFTVECIEFSPRSINMTIPNITHYFYIEYDFII